MTTNPDNNDELMLADEEDDLGLADEEDDLIQADEENNQIFTFNSRADSWKVMIVDDEVEIHDVTQLALEDFVFKNKPLTFLSAYSAEQAQSLLKKHPDVALILLDVVMEEKDSGLKVAKYIRDTLHNHLVRIILRTGQPGEAPEESVIVDYDINDYKLKIELTRSRLFVTVVSGLRSYYDLITLEASKAKLAQLNTAYQRFVPHEFLKLLNKQSIVDIQLGEQVEQEMTILFSDIRGFTTLSEKMTPQENFDFINAYLSQMEPIIGQYHGFIDKYIGDGIMALFPTSADDAVQGAIAMLKTLADYNSAQMQIGLPPISIGIGLNTGQLMLGTIGGKNRMDGTVIADAVNLASRIEGMTKTYGTTLLISQNTYSHLQDVLQYAVRTIDCVKVKGKAKAVTIYEVFDSDAPHIVDLKRKTLIDLENGLTHYCQKEFAQAHQCFQQMLHVYPEDKVAQIYRQRCEHFQQVGVADDWQAVAILESK